MLTFLFGAVAPWWNFARCKIHFLFKSCILLYWQRYCTALEQPASAKLCGVVRRMELRIFRRWRHLYSAGQPSRWASAHILVKSFVPSPDFEIPEPIFTKLCYTMWYVLKLSHGVFLCPLKIWGTKNRFLPICRHKFDTESHRSILQGKSGNLEQQSQSVARVWRP